MATLDNDEAIDIDLMWLHSIAYEARQGKPVNPEELDSIARAVAGYLRTLRSENEKLIRIIRDAALNIDVLSERLECAQREIRDAQDLIKIVQDETPMLKPQAK